MPSPPSPARRRSSLFPRFSPAPVEYFTRGKHHGLPCILIDPKCHSAAPRRCVPPAAMKSHVTRGREAVEKGGRVRGRTARREKTKSRRLFRFFRRRGARSLLVSSLSLLDSTSPQDAGSGRAHVSDDLGGHHLCWREVKGEKKRGKAGRGRRGGKIFLKRRKCKKREQREQTKPSSLQALTPWLFSSLDSASHTSSPRPSLSRSLSTRGTQARAFAILASRRKRPTLPEIRERTKQVPASLLSFSQRRRKRKTFDDDGIFFFARRRPRGRVRHPGRALQRRL